MSSQARLSPAARREQLLSVAREMLRSRPVDEVTIEAVASVAGVSPGLVFHYFGSQREFRRAVTEQAVTELLSALEPSAELPAADQLREGLDTFTLAVARSPELFVTIVRAADSLASGFRSTIISWLRAAVEGDGVAMTPALEAALAGWLAFAEQVILGWVNSESLSREEVVELCARAFLGILGAAGIPAGNLSPARS
jgi:AcrR family transcriptional regulator